MRGAHQGLVYDIVHLPLGQLRPHRVLNRAVVEAGEFRHLEGHARQSHRGY